MLQKIENSPKIFSFPFFYLTRLKLVVLRIISASNKIYTKYIMLRENHMAILYNPTSAERYTF